MRRRPNLLPHIRRTLRSPALWLPPALAASVGTTAYQLAGGGLDAVPDAWGRPAWIAALAGLAAMAVGAAVAARCDGAGPETGT